MTMRCVRVSQGRPGPTGISGPGTLPAPPGLPGWRAMPALRGPSGLRALPALLGLLCLLVLSASAQAWTTSGHYLTSLLTYRELTPEQRSRIDAILRAHPRFQQDLLANRPEGVPESEWAFLVAGAWPDVIRDQRNPMHFVAHRPNWHFTNLPYHPDGGQDLFVPTPPQPLRPGEPWDSISAWEFNLARLGNLRVPMSQRAIALCWVLHLASDIHQPLHNVSLFSADHPTGDRGGNDQMFLVDGQPMNLHLFWDFLMGRSREYADIAALADAITARVPVTALGGDPSNLDVRQWVREAAALAISHAYRYGAVRGAVRARHQADPNLPLPTLPEGYAEAARQVAERQIRLAALRTALALSTVNLAPSEVPEPPPPTPPATPLPAPTPPTPPANPPQP